jgi:AP2-like factor (ANT lineage)
MKSSEDTKHGCPDDIGSELKTSEREVKCTQPYQMPHLGLSVEGKGHTRSTISALSILSQSAAYKSLQEKASKKQETSTENDENENKNTVNKMDRGKAVEKSTSHDGCSERLGATLGITGGLSLQRNVYPSTPFLSAPLLTNYNTIDPLVDPILWTSLVPALPTGLSRNPEVGLFLLKACQYFSSFFFLTVILCFSCTNFTGFSGLFLLKALSISLSLPVFLLECKLFFYKKTLGR